MHAALSLFWILVFSNYVVSEAAVNVWKTWFMIYISAICLSWVRIMTISRLKIAVYALISEIKITLFTTKSLQFLSIFVRCCKLFGLIRVKLYRVYNSLIFRTLHGHGVKLTNVLEEMWSHTVGFGVLKRI